jgi:hypothetical protein
LSSKACYAGEVFPPYFTRVSATAAADAQGFEQAIDPSREAPVFLDFDSPLRDCLWVARLPLAPTAHLVGKVFASVVSKRQLQSDMEERCKNTLPGDFEIAEQQKRCEHFPNNNSSELLLFLFNSRCPQHGGGHGGFGGCTL